MSTGTMTGGTSGEAGSYAFTWSESEGEGSAEWIRSDAAFYLNNGGPSGGYITWYLWQSSESGDVRIASLGPVVDTSPAGSSAAGTYSDGSVFSIAAIPEPATVPPALLHSGQYQGAC